jgi:hypothetical protein
MILALLVGMAAPALAQSVDGLSRAIDRQELQQEIQRSETRREYQRQTNELQRQLDQSQIQGQLDPHRIAPPPRPLFGPCAGARACN